MGERGHYFLRLVFPFFVVLFLAISNMHWYLEETDTITPESSNTSQEYEVSEGFQEGIPTNEIKFDLSLNILCYIFNYSEGVSCIESFPFSPDNNSENSPSNVFTPDLSSYGKPSSVSSTENSLCVLTDRSTIICWSNIQKINEANYENDIFGPFYLNFNENPICNYAIIMVKCQYHFVNSSK